MTSDKNLVVISSPEEPKRWPTPPTYEPVWDYAKIEQGIRGMALPRSNSDWMTFILGIVPDYDQALSKARFELWQEKQWNEFLKGKEASE